MTVQQNTLFTTILNSALNRPSGSGANGFGGGGVGGVAAELRCAAMSRWSGKRNDALETGSSTNTPVSAADHISIISPEMGGNIEVLKVHIVVSLLAMSVASALSSFVFRPPSVELSLFFSMATVAGDAAQD